MIKLLGKSQIINFKATAPKNILVIGEPIEINLSLNLGTNQIFDTVFFKLSELGDSLGNNWELWDKSNIKKYKSNESP